MDIKIFSKLLCEILKENNSLYINSLGLFYSQDIPSYISEDKISLFPPSQKWNFDSKKKNEDELFVDSFSKLANISKEESKFEIEKFILWFKNELVTKKTIKIEGVGEFLYNNSIGFIMSQDFVQYHYVGLEPINLRNHKKAPILIKTKSKILINIFGIISILTALIGIIYLLRNWIVINLSL